MSVHGILCKDEAEWLETRRTLGIGASDAAAILGVSRFKSPYQLWHEKLGLQVVSEEETEAQEWGKTLERPIVKKYERKTKRTVEKPNRFLILQDEQFPYMFCTLDGLITSCPDRPEVGTRRIPLEVKTAHWLLKGNWKEEPPVEYVVQVQHQAAVTGAPFVSIGALVGGSEFLWCDIERDDEFIAQLRQLERDFWESLKAGIPPPIDGTASTRATLKALYARDIGTVVGLGGEAIQWDNDLIAVKKQIDEAKAPLEKEKARLENLFIAAIGHATAGTLPNGTVYTYRTTDRGAYTVAPTSYRSLKRKGGPAK